jgi:hypothetical protein
VEQVEDGRQSHLYWSLGSISNFLGDAEEAQMCRRLKGPGGEEEDGWLGSLNPPFRKLWR